jgi:SRSO17 transposase
MIPIVEMPSWITDFSGKMKLSHHQTRFLSALLTGLISSANKTIEGIASVLVGGPSKTSLNKFLTKYDWDSKKVNHERIRELQRHNETRWKKRGLGIIDDTLIEKAGRRIQGVGKFFDYAKGRFVYGHSMVSLHFADHKTSYAVDYRLYLKKGCEGFRTKIELAMEMITESIEEMQFPAFTFVFDSWYLCKELVDHVESYGRLWIAACKSDRLILVDGGYVSLAGYFDSLRDSDFTERTVNGKKLLVHHITVHFKSLGKKARLIISKDGKETLFLATNRSGTVEGIIADYMLRWSIETFHKDAKQHLGLDKCQMRGIEGIKRYWYVVFMAHSVLRLGASEGILARAISRKSVTNRVKGACLDVLSRFVYWILEKGNHSEIMKVMEAVMGYK